MMDCLPETEPNAPNVSEEVANKVHQLRRGPKKMKNAMAAVAHRSRWCTSSAKSTKEDDEKMRSKHIEGQKDRYVF